MLNLLHISFGSDTANTQNTDVTTLKINIIIYAQLTTHYFDF